MQRICADRIRANPLHPRYPRSIWGTGMALDAGVEVRPRSTGEILDDAWRLVLADAPLLLTLSSLFTAPAVFVWLLLLTQPAPSGWAPA